MTIYWDEKILDVWNSIQTRRQLAEMEEQQAHLTMEECLDSVRKGILDYEGRRFEFAASVLFDGKLSIQLPRSMQLIPRGRGSSSGGNHQNEQLTYKEENSAVMLGLNHMAHLLPMSGVESFVQAMTAQVKKTQAGLQVVHNELIELDGCRIACSEFIIPIEDKSYYQILFATSMDGQALLGSFHFESEEVLVWQPLAHALIRTLRVEQNLNMT
ncbi:hypothetical protein ACFYU8_12400 [Brevibacillus sp. NPDC003359]|uniref:hypothetical protein n=1 Tax=unclassified Brevibacillus TaxID=2684853 RepID=UPI0036A27AEF